MKKALLFLFVLVSSLSWAQASYPTPPQSANRLFYIQHSDNTNTYVYDFNAKNEAEPIAIHRILYAEDGSTKELTPLQRKMAYGVTVKKLAPQRYSFTLAATKNQLFYLEWVKAKPQVFTTIENQKLRVTRLFVEMTGQEGNFISKPKAIRFEGTDAKTGKRVVKTIAADQFKF